MQHKLFHLTITSQVNSNNPKKQAVITLNELQEIIHVFLIDIHNQNSHTKLKSTRASVWNYGVQSYPISLPSSDKTLKVLLGDVEERTISRKGIEFYYLSYNSDRLQALRDRYEAIDFRKRDKIRRKEKAKFKYNRNNISVIHVLEPQTREYIAVPAINQNYTQALALAQHRIIHRFALNHGFIQGGKNVDVVALALAKQEIQNIVNKAIIEKTKAAKTSKKVIKYMGTGRSEDVILAQENSIKAIEPMKLYDEINVNVEPVSSKINAGISDFSSAIDFDENTKEIAVEVLPDDSVDTQRETKSSKNQKKPKSNTRKKSAAKKSKSKRTNKSNSTLSKHSTNSPKEKQRTTDEIDEKSSSTEAKNQLPKQERESRASIGLPDWKPRTRF